VFDYTFLDEDFGRQYEAEQKLGRLFRFFATVAVFIACLGLFGLAAYAAERRTKEIGVRKVLGASARDVVLLLSKEFTALVLLAFVVAAPLAFFAMRRWLESFAYRVDLGVGVFLLAGLIAVVIGFATVSTQALRAASTDPVKALRYE
jgi:putative ABC transport system permease protein